uniref:Uncharacterized protein n=1 Tax=Anguilla anguilla TaxID=7936 RepID=A0A0E9XBF0_ANGAN
MASASALLLTLFLVGAASVSKGADPTVRAALHDRHSALYHCVGKASIPWSRLGVPHH